LFAGMLAKNRVNASRPPADAPIPTTRESFSDVEEVAGDPSWNGTLPGATGPRETLGLPDCFFRAMLPTTTLQVWPCCIRAKLQPSEKWPNAANGRTRSQTTFVIASIGTDSI